MLKRTLLFLLVTVSFQPVLAQQTSEKSDREKARLTGPVAAEQIGYERRSQAQTSPVLPKS